MTITIQELEQLLTAYNNQLKAAEKQLTKAELDRQRAAFLEKMKQIL